MVCKCLNGMVPQYLNDKITCNDNIHKYCTRSVNDLHVNKPNTAYYASNFEVSGTLSYNILPNHIKQQPSLNQFKNSAKRHLLAQNNFKGSLILFF